MLHYFLNSVIITVPRRLIICLFLASMVAYRVSPVQLVVQRPRC